VVSTEYDDDEASPQNHNRALALLVIGVGVFAALVFGDLASYTATGSEVKSPTVALVGKALLVYDPGLSGAASAVANKIADDLTAKGYEVTYADV
jgi:hypothetical protein